MTWQLINSFNLPQFTVVRTLLNTGWSKSLILKVNEIWCGILFRKTPVMLPGLRKKSIFCVDKANKVSLNLCILLKLAWNRRDTSSYKNVFDNIFGWLAILVSFTNNVVFFYTCLTCLCGPKVPIQAKCLYHL